MPTHTAAGTPCARSWSEDWIATVNAKETECNRPICGARLPEGLPCTNTSNHPSGRCKLHGGFDLTGAPPGNRNAVIHGLYTRRLRTCSTACPCYQTCPLSSGASAKEDAASNPNHSPTDPSVPSHSSLSPHPTCPYQLAEYNTVLTDALAIVESQPHPNPMGLHAAHNVAMLQVLVNAAATAVARASSPWSSNHPGTGLDPAMITAYIRLMRELRASLRSLAAPAHPPLFRQNQNATPPSPEGILRHAQRRQHDTGLDPDSLEAAQLEPQTTETHAKAYLQQAIQAASQGRDVEMAEAYDNVILLDEHLADTERDHVLASYRPAKHSVSEELADAILGNLHLPPRPEADHETPGVTSPCATCQMYAASNNLLQHYVDNFRDGKIPPEAFPIGSKIRSLAEQIYTGPDHASGTNGVLPRTDPRDTENEQQTEAKGST